MIPYGRQDITEEDIDAVVDVLRSDFLTQGPVVPQFEEVVHTLVGADYAIAVNSATSALHIACLALGLGRGDWLWTSPITFVASANCGIYCGAQVDFVDIDPRTYNICPFELEKKLLAAEKEGKLPKVLVAVHLCGQSCDMESIHALCQKYNVRIIEDASHAIGGKYKGQFIGNCRYSDITVFSFHPVKIITTGEGGVALTNDPVLAGEMTLLRGHGITRDESMMTDVADGPWYYEQLGLGFNYRMTDIQAALGVSQISRLHDMISKRCIIKQRYDEGLRNTPLRLPYIHHDAFSALHLYPVLIDEDRTSLTRKEVFDDLRGHGIGVNVHYIPVHLQPYYQSMGFKKGDFPNAEEYYSKTFSLPLFSNLSNSDQAYVIQTLKGIFE